MSLLRRKSSSRLARTSLRSKYTSSATQTVACSSPRIYQNLIHWLCSLLLKSGVGSVNVLREFGIDTVSHLKGVGKHLQDHPIVGLKYRLGEPEGEWWPISSSKMSLIREPISILWRYLTQGKGALSSAGCDLGYFGWSNESYIGRPDLQVRFRDRVFWSVMGSLSGRSLVWVSLDPLKSFALAQNSTKQYKTMQKQYNTV